MIKRDSFGEHLVIHAEDLYAALGVSYEDFPEDLNIRAWVEDNEPYIHIRTKSTEKYTDRGYWTTSRGHCEEKIVYNINGKLQVGTASE